MSNLDLDKMNLKTGDLLLFNGTTFWFSRLVERVTHSPWSHVGIVLKDPTYINQALTGYYLLESGEESEPDAEDGANKFGVQISDLRDVLEGYGGKVVVRHLEIEVPDMENKLVEIHNTVHNKPYDINLCDLLETKLNINFPTPYFNWKILNYFRKDHRRTDTFFCSALVAYIYTELGLLPNDTQWTCCEPDYFSEKNTQSQITKGALGQEITLVDH